jgi:predicted nuclease of restriction endonuclease-like (RecB) superfamily
MKLTKDFGKGFTEANLRMMRLFYISFPIRHAVRDKLEKMKKHDAVRVKSEIQVIGNAVPKQLEPELRAELSWTHYRLLLKVKNDKARFWYMNEAADNGWSTRVLERQINSFYYERLLKSEKKDLLKKEVEENIAVVSPENILEFLDLDEKSVYRESDLEQELIDKLHEFLLELGKGFSFVARQKRIITDDEDFYIDLVFYNYILKCFVLIDLKIGKLTHQDIGQMDMYVRLYEDKFKIEGDNPTIGIILCSDKNETVVKYSVLNESKQIFASKYQLYLPTEEELAEQINKEKNIIREREMKYGVKNN